MSKYNSSMRNPRDRSAARQHARDLGRQQHGGRMIRPTVGGEQIVHIGSASDENQPGYEIDETIADTATTNITLADTTWAGAVFIDYWMKSGTDSTIGACAVYQTGAGGAALGIRRESGDSMNVTLAATLAGTAMRLSVTNNTGADLAFNGRYYYCGV